MKSLTDYTNELQARVAGVTLLGELPYDEIDLAALRAGLRPLFAGSTSDALRRIDGRHDLALAVYLVLEGTYHYDAGDFWSSPQEHLSFKSNAQNAIGERFRATLRQWGLPTFEHLAQSERARVNIAPILTHVGVPNYCLGDLFDLLDRARRNATPDAATLMAEWSDGDFPATIDRPVRRFLLHGGRVAEDFVNRCLGLMGGDGEDPGLPRRVVARFEQWRAEDPARAVAAGPRLLRPTLSLDPWGEGVRLDLKPVKFPFADAPERLVWRVVARERERQETAVRRRRGACYVYEPREPINVLSAAPTYTVSLLADGRELRRWTLDGPGDPPLLAFDPDTGETPTRRGDGRPDELLISPGEHWLVYPRDWRPQATDSARRLGELPPQEGEWAGFAFETWRLEPGGRLALFAADGRRAAFRAHHDADPPRPRLVGPRAVDNGPTASLYAAPPAVVWPHVEQPAAWKVALEPLGPALPAEGRHGTLDDLAHRLALADDGLRLPLDAPELLGPSPFGAFRLSLRGPYGRTTHFELRVVVGLRVEGYPRLYLGEAAGPAAFDVVCPAGVIVQAADDEPGLTLAQRPEGPGASVWAVGAESHLSRARLVLTHFPSGAEVEADVPLYHVRWGLRQPDRPDQFDWGGAPLDLYPDSMDNRHAVEIRVDRPYWGQQPPATGWQLIGLGGRVLRGPLWSDRPGRYAAAALVEWLDAYQEARGPACLQLLLDTGAAEPAAIDLAYLRPSLDVGAVEAGWTVGDDGDTVTLLWERNIPLQGRQLRLWPLDRPWVTQPIVLPVPDSADGCHEWGLPSGALSLGEYLGEFVVADPWGGAAARPGPDAPGVFRLLPDDLARLVPRRLLAAGPDSLSVETLLSLLHCAARRPELGTILPDVGHALWRRRAELTSELLLLWANVVRAAGNTPGYRLAQQALFASEPAAALTASSLNAQTAALWLGHLPPRLSQREVYAALLPFASGESRRLCIEELCRDGHQAGFTALLEDVACNQLSLDDAVTLLEVQADRAVDYLLTTELWSAQAVLRELLRRRPATSLIARGVDLHTDLGYARVTSVRDKRTGKPVTACRNAAGPYEVWAEVSPGTDPVTLILDLQTRQIRFPYQAYRCRHNNDACNRVFGSAERLRQHYLDRPHRLAMPYIVEKTNIPPRPLRRLKVMPPDGVEI